MLSLLFAALLLTGCSSPLFVGDWSVQKIQATLPEDSAENILAVDFAALESVRLDPAWSQRYAGVVGADMGPAGQRIAVFGPLGRELGFDVLGPDGKRLWGFRYPHAGLRSTYVHVTGEPLVVAAVASDWSQNGYVYVFDVQGSELWQRRVDGSSSVVVSGDAQRFAVLNHVEGRLHLLDAKGSTLGSYRISPAASAAFFGKNNLLLINDAENVRLVANDGQVLLSQKISRDFKRTVVLSPDGRRVAVTTTQTDSTVYVFDTQGKLLWSKPLFLGGTNQPMFSPDGKSLYVYNVGDGAGVYGFDAQSGDVLLRLFPTVPEGFQASIRRLWATGRALILDYVTTPRAAEGKKPGDVWEEHALIVTDPRASRMRRFDVGRNVEVDLSDDGRRLLVVHHVAAGEGSAQTDVKLYDLAPLYGQGE